MKRRAAGTPPQRARANVTIINGKRNQLEMSIAASLAKQRSVRHICFESARDEFDLPTSIRENVEKK